MPRTTSDDSAADRRHEPDRGDRIDRLGLALEAWSGFSGHGDPQAVAAFLAAHAELRDLLEPMFATDDGPLGAVPGEAMDGPPTDAPNAGHPVAAALGPGQLLGDHRIVREVGRGGMGTVFEAEQISLRRRVALKLLHDHLTWSPKSIERFRREAAAAARLNHQGIAPIHEVGEHGGRHYFTMEFVDGVPLHEAMQRPRFGVRADCSRAAEAAELVARVADALQHAHEHGLVHRDVKPQNIMVCPDGSVRLLDFGLVKQQDLPHETLTHEFLGTPHYSSPEQVAGEPTGPASDVFSLGIVLYELLAGRRPFTGDTPRDVLHRIELGDAVPLPRVAPATPRDLVTICAKAMEPIPSRRYAQAGDMAADLRRFLRIEPILAEPPGPLRRAAKWLRRHRLRVGLWTLTSLLVVGTPTAIAVHEAGTRSALEAINGDLLTAERVAFQSIEQTLAMLAENIERQPDPVSYQGPRLDAVMRLCEQFLALRTVDDDRRLRAARAFLAIAAIQAQLELLPAASRANARAAELLAAIAPEFPRREVTDLDGRRLRQELRLRQMQDPTGPDAEFRAATARWRTAVGRPDAPLHEVVEFAEILVLRARALADLPPRRAEAEAVAQEAMALLLPERTAESRTAAILAARVGNVFGHLQLWARRHADAIATLQGVLEQIGDPQTASFALERTLALAALGEAKAAAGDTDTAQRLLQQSLEAGRVQAAAYPGSAALRRALHSSRLRLATLFLVQNRVADAERLLREASAALATTRTRAGAVPTWMERAMRAEVDGQLANCILMRTNGSGNCEEARELLRGVCTLLGGLVRERPEDFDCRIDLGGAWNNLAALANQQGDPREAADAARIAIEHQAAVLAVDPGNVRAQKFLGMHHGQLAFASAGLGDHETAMAAAEQAIANCPRHTMTLRLAAEAATMAASRANDPAIAETGARIAIAALAKAAAVDRDAVRGWCADGRFAFLRGRPHFEQLRTKGGDK